VETRRRSEITERSRFVPVSVSDKALHRLPGAIARDQEADAGLPRGMRSFSLSGVMERQCQHVLLFKLDSMRAKLREITATQPSRRGGGQVLADDDLAQ